MTDRTIAAASQAQGWDLQAHNQTTIDGVIAHFEDLLDEETGTLKRKLKEDEIRWIQNERKLCSLDFRYWSSHYAWLISFEKRPMLFTPNIAQDMVLDIFAEFEEAGRAIHLQQLKARRLCMSTISELAVQHRFQFHPYSNCVVASADPGKSVLMAEMINFSHEHQPWWLLPQVTKHSKNMPAEFGDIHTTLTIQAGNQFNGVARGATPSVVHLSELAEWDDAASLVDAALYRAIIDTPNVFCILESTAEGRGNWWHTTWLQNKKDWDRGRGRVRPIFLPWYVGTDLYPPKQDAYARPIPANWIPDDRTIRHAERAKNFVLTNPLLFKHLAKGSTEWEMSRDQMWWHEIEYDSAKEKKELHIFLSECPADDMEAFQNDKISVVDLETVQEYRESTVEPWGVFTILGPDIPQSLTVSKRYWDRSKSPITIRTSSLLKIDVTYQLMPLLWEGYQSATDPALKLFVWEPPEQGATYGVGVDTSDGVGEDNSVIEVVRRGEMGRRAAQVAEFVSPYIKAFQLWPMILAVSVWYSTFSEMAQRKTQCRVAIECRDNGESAQFQMQLRGWQNFHPWKKYDNRKRVQDGKVHKIGVFTMHWWRSQMMDYILTLVDELALDLPSPWFVDELASLQRDYESQKMKAANDAHDDRFMALGFALFSMDVERIRRPSYNDRRPASLMAENIDSTEHQGQYAVWRPSSQGSSTTTVGAHPIQQNRQGRLTLGAYRSRSGKGW